MGRRTIVARIRRSGYLLVLVALLSSSSVAAQTSQLKASLVSTDDFEGGKVVLDVLAKVTAISPSTLGSATIDIDYSSDLLTFLGVVGSDINPSADGYSFSAGALTGDPVSGDGSGDYVRIAVSGASVGPGFGQGPGFDVQSAYGNLARLEFGITSAGVGASASDLDLFIRTGSASLGFFENAANNPATGVIVESTISEIINANDISLAIDDGDLAFEGDYLFDPPYPNPFNALSQFDVAVKEAQPVVIEVFDAVGRRVAKLHDGPLAPNQRVHFRLDGTRLGSGIYHVRARGKEFSAVRSIVLVK